VAGTKANHDNLLTIALFLLPMKQIIVVGGGFLGSHASKLLEKKFNVTLIDTKDYFEFTPGILRTIVDPSHIKKVQVLHTHYLKRTKFIRAEVKTIGKNYIEINGKKYKFDYLVLGLGSKYKSQIKQENIILSSRAQILRQAHSKLLDSNKVVIVGGGLVGVELAAEIAEYMPKKHITLIHSKDKLMPRNHQKSILHATNFLKKRKVEIIYNERVEEISSNYVTTKNGLKIDCDMIFMCVGIQPNSKCVQNSFPLSLDEKNCVKVNEFLQLESASHIFAAGDFAGIKEEKTAQSAERSAEVIVRNINHLEKKEKLEKYMPKKRIMVISLGKWNGSLEYNNFCVTGFIPGVIKSLVEWKTMRRYK
jgi:apoptosis-inducing factor 2